MTIIFCRTVILSFNVSIVLYNYWSYLGKVTFYLYVNLVSIGTHFSNEHVTDGGNFEHERMNMCSKRNNFLSKILSDSNIGTLYNQNTWYFDKVT